MRSVSASLSTPAFLTLTAVSLFILPAQSSADQPTATLAATVIVHADQDEDLAYIDQVTKSELLDVLNAAKIDQYQHPEIARALGHYGQLTVDEQIVRRREVLASIPTLQPVKKSDSYVSSDYGERNYSFSASKQFHKGIDLAGNDGVAIYAPADGIVRYAAKYGRYGNYISVVHGYGFVTKFAHIEKMLVKEGQVVRRGEKIATMGRTGRVTGTHLHYEIWLNDQAVDPRRFMLSLPDDVTGGMTIANVDQNK